MQGLTPDLVYLHHWLRKPELGWAEGRRQHAVGICHSPGITEASIHILFDLGHHLKSI